jgi:ABC-type dipeptide/oligopeptide/nickel transport system permease component
MFFYIIRRILVAIPLMFGLVAIVFFLLRTLVPGDPAVILAGENATVELIEQVRRAQGLDKPLPEQFAIFVGNVLKGDLGRSSSTRQPVVERIALALPTTAALTLSTFLYSFSVGLFLGIITAYWRDSWLDNTLRVVTIFGASMPTFWLGPMLMLLFAIILGWLPAQGSLSLRGLILPTITLGTGAAAELSRLVRGSMLEVLSSDYIRTARSKGLAEKAVVIRHALSNALIPVVTIAAAQIGGLLGGAVITESIFGLPGIGTLSINAINDRDYAVIQGTVLFICGIYLFVNLLADITYAFIDPRIRIS